MGIADIEEAMSNIIIEAEQLIKSQEAKALPVLGPV